MYEKRKNIECTYEYRWQIYRRSWNFQLQEKEKIVFAHVDPESVQEQETDSYIVDGFKPDVK